MLSEPGDEESVSNPGVATLLPAAGAAPVSPVPSIPPGSDSTAKL